ECNDLPTAYVSGDNASLPLVEQIADRFPDIEIAVLFAGAARVPSTPANLTLNSADAAAAARILGASRVVGLHTEDWAHFSETREQLEAAFADSAVLVATPRGVMVEL
ncbi:MAG: MBL fold metallo-hydrolase, partial [Salinibacterium sp.]|nr:MBL fold metallo-hydrolase [Salinibacterium sp.]